MILHPTFLPQTMYPIFKKVLKNIESGVLKQLKMHSVSYEKPELKSAANRLRQAILTHSERKKRFTFEVAKALCMNLVLLKKISNEDKYSESVRSISRLLVQQHRAVVSFFDKIEKKTKRGLVATKDNHPSISESCMVATKDNDSSISESSCAVANKDNDPSNSESCAVANKDNEHPISESFTDKEEGASPGKKYSFYRNRLCPSCQCNLDSSCPLCAGYKFKRFFKQEFTERLKDLSKIQAMVQTRRVELEQIEHQHNQMTNSLSRLETRNDSGCSSCHDNYRRGYRSPSKGNDRREYPNPRYTSHMSISQSHDRHQSSHYNRVNSSNKYVDGKRSSGMKRTHSCLNEELQNSRNQVDHHKKKINLGHQLLSNDIPESGGKSTHVTKNVDELPSHDDNDEVSCSSLTRWR